jgi:general secretion pathway protein A
MYESRFGITGPPFQLSPDPTFYFDSRGHHRALEELRRGLTSDAGVVVITGEIGAGKTTLIRTMLGELDPETLVVAHIVSTQLNAQELLAAACLGFGLPLNDGESKELAGRLLRFLVKLEKHGRIAVLIIDEAQNLHHDAFDQLVALAKRRAPRPLPLQLCLVGQPELRGMVDTAALSALRKLVTVSFHLGPIEREEVAPYIEHRLHKVGWSGSPKFEDGAFDEIFRWTEGIPRRINLLCNRLMLSCFLSAETRIDVDTVAQTARDLRAEIGDSIGDPPPLAAARPLSRVPDAAPVRPTYEASNDAINDAIEDASEQADPEATVIAPANASVTASVTAPVAAPPSFSGKPPRLDNTLIAPIERGLVLCVVAGHSDHIKAAALMRAMAARPELPLAKLVRVHSNDALALCHALFEGIDVAKGLISLGIADGPPQTQAAELRKTFEFVVDHVLPRAVIVFDGSEAAYACSTVARAKGVPIVHIGAGLRVNDTHIARPQTRKRTDDLADLLYTTDAHASQALADEGLPLERVHCAGSLLVDAVQMAVRLPVSPVLAAAPGEAPILDDRNGYAVVVLSQTSNISDRAALIEILSILQDASRDVPLVWPMHARLEAELKKHRLDGFISSDRILRLPAQAYPEYVELLSGATCVLTDSWSTQEEATALGVPCLTIGNYPARSITVAVGSNVLVGNNRTTATRVLWESIFNGGKRGRLPELWDGKTGARIAGYLSAWLPEAGTPRPARGKTLAEVVAFNQSSSLQSSSLQS